MFHLVMNFQIALTRGFIWTRVHCKLLGISWTRFKSLKIEIISGPARYVAPSTLLVLFDWFVSELLLDARVVSELTAQTSLVNEIMPSIERTLAAKFHT